MRSIGKIAIASADPPRGSRQHPMTLPPSRATSCTTGVISGDVISSAQFKGSSPRDLGAAFFGTRFFRIGFLLTCSENLAHPGQPVLLDHGRRSQTAATEDTQL